MASPSFVRCFRTTLMVALLSAHGWASAAPVSANAYSLTSIDGSWVYGFTDWNGVSTFGQLNNTTELAAVETMMSNGYVAASPTSSPSAKNGIYKWKAGFGGSASAGLSFAFDGGVDYALSGLQFLSSRSYSSATKIYFDVARDGGAWHTVASTTSGALGMTGGTAKSYQLNFAEVTADAFRLRLEGGDQVSLHELSLTGAVANHVPEPSSAWLAVLAVVAAGGITRRQGRAAA